MRLYVLLGLVGFALAMPEPYQLTPPRMEMKPGGGLHMSIADESGITLFAVHYSVNKPLPGVAAGDHNYDVPSKTGNRWIHENSNLGLSVGDTVNYWILVVKNGQGLQLTDQSWTVAAATEPTSPTTTTTTTPGSTTTTTQGPTTTTTPYTGPTTVPTRPPPEVPECTSYPCLVFEDNFDKLNLDNWEHEITAGGGGNWEFQYYLNNRTNSYVKNGNLFIRPTLTSDRYGEEFLSRGNLDLWGSAPPNVCTGNGFFGCSRVGNPTNLVNPVQSARIRSVNSMNVRYGKVEVRAKLPKGDWLWPAIWMLPKREQYGIWPASGEIDLVESRGNLDMVNEQGRQMGHLHGGATLHWGPFFEFNSWERTAEFVDWDYSLMHTYGVEWDEDSLRFFFDGNLIRTIDPGPGGFWGLGEFQDKLPQEESNPWRNGDKMAPFDQEFYLIMNVAVGGTNGFFQDTWINRAYPKPWRNDSPQAFLDFWRAKNQWYPTWRGDDAAMQVDYVRVWKLKDN